MPKWFSRLAGGPRLALAVAFLLALSAMAYGATQKPLRIGRGGDTASVPSSGSTSTTGSGSQTPTGSRSATATTPTPTLTPAPSPTAARTSTPAAASAAPAVKPAAPTAPPRTAPPPPPPASRGYDHIFFVIDENNGRSNIIGPAPYLTSLANANAQSANYFAISHPSLPNYLALTSGSTQGVTDDGTGYVFNVNNLANQVSASGRTWKAYNEDLPGPCDNTGGTGGYAKKHQPYMYYADILNVPAQCNRVVPYTQLAGDLASAATTPNYVWITPNLCNDMHDCSVQQGDSWAQSNFAAIFNSPAWKTQHSLFLMTWDEDSGNQVAMFAMSSDGSTKARFTSTVPATHYSLLRTIEALWGLSPVGAGDAAASPMTDLFTNWQGAHTSVPTAPTPPATAATGASAVGRTGIRLEAWWNPDRARLGSPEQLI